MGILSLQNASYTYRSKYQTVKAVRGASFEFEQGSVYAIIGKSGSGKTTLLSLLAGLDLPTEGNVLFDGTSTKKLNRDLYRRQDVAVIYQGFNLFPLLTVLENVMYPLELQGKKVSEAKKRAIEMLHVVGLVDAQFKRYPSMLSGGEQQRVAIARALASNAKVILADEPTGNLDVENSGNVVEMLVQLAHERNCCVIIVTHDLAVSKLADVCLRMRDGVLNEDTCTEEA